MRKRYKLYRNKKYRRYKNYRRSRNDRGNLEYGYFKTRIAVLNDYADIKDRQSFLGYINRQPARWKLFNFWKYQRADYEHKQTIDMLDRAMGDRY